MSGYHLNKIERGVFGEISKITEEFEEFKDANLQGVKLMELQELSDMLGAIEGYLTKNHPGITMNDLIDMSNVTQRAFKSGDRIPK